ncbi:MAG: alanine racemase [Pseudomonadota bacterium]
MKRAAYALVNLAHLKNNLAAIRNVAKQSKITAVVKADAYGHGMLQVCNALNDADEFSVAYVNEAMELRDSGIQKPLLALQGFRTEDDLKNAIEQNIQLVIHDHEQVKILKTIKSPTLKICIKIDTGMHRLGFDATEVPVVLEQLQNSISSASKISLMTHLACADELENDTTLEQLKKFDAIASKFDFEQSIANSAGILAWPQSHRDWVRPGLMLYGINPIESVTTVDELELRAVMSLHAPLISIKTCKKGEKIGYGGDFCCPKDMLIGIIAIGYADGYPRHLKSAPNVSLGTKLVPILGRISMDMIAVDLTGIDTKVGDIAELWGEAISVTDVAQHAETISYELLCAAGNAVIKKYIQ